MAESGLRLGADEAGDGGRWPRPAVALLAQWLRDYAGPIGRPELALTAARTAFEHTLALRDYGAAQAWAGASWEAMRPELPGARHGSARCKNE